MMTDNVKKRIERAIEAGREALQAQHEAEGGEGDVPEYKVLTAACAGFRLTDIGNAERLVARFGDRLRFVTETESWAAYDGKRWNLAAGNTLARERAQEVIRLMYIESSYARDETHAAEILKHADRSAKSSNTKGMLEQGQALMTASLMDFDTQPHLLNTGGGVVDLRSGAVYAHSSELMLTKIAPVQYRPDARAPEWEQFIDDVTCGDTELAAFLQRAIGYSAFASQEEQLAFFLTGDDTNTRKNGSNGKSLFLETLKSAFGDYSATTDRRLIARDRNDEADPKTRKPLIGARFATGSEFKRGDVIETQGFKALTGDEAVKAKILYRDEVDLWNGAALWFATNYVPFVADDDDGAWRRMLVIPFLAKFYENAKAAPKGAKVKDTKLKKKLQSELPGVLAWIVRGAVDYEQNGLQVLERLQMQRDERQSDSDALHDFLELCIERGDHTTSAADLLSCYRKFCESNGETPMTGTAFGLKLGERGISKDDEATKRKRKVMRHGARLSSVGQAYLNGRSPDTADNLTVIEGGFAYKIDTKTDRAKSVDDLPHEIRKAVLADSKGLPPVGRQVATRIGTFERLAD